FHLILMNPPYHATARGHTTPNTTKAQAHSLPPHALAGWLNTLIPLLTPTGTLALILHTACLPEALATAQTHTLATTVIPLQTSPTRPAKRVLVHLTPCTTYSLTQHPPIPAYTPTLRQSILSQGQHL
ncbi:MAG: hypothetical protein WAZ18_06115, partial [Alphaproteobacteria bacterium]